jgi:sporulation protein YlmC with PRC-barrel domain
LFGALRPNRSGLAIDWRQVRRIGDDVILVDIEAEKCGT